ncbi:MAG: hypothetical protein L6R42_005046 [Xanthoria sp. 1 TBL-2021]|nr:MAG: hypothetical protein L6R42_005046 [Xanthoria sp. 1 TBL-2021]
MADIPADSFLHFDLDPRGMPYQSTTRVSWPIPNDQSSSRPSSQSSASANLKRSTSPFDTIDSLYDQSFDPHVQQQQPFIPQWPISQPSHSSLTFPFGDSYQQPFDSDYDVAYHSSPTDFLPAHPQLETALQMDGSYVPLGGQMDSMSLNWPQSYQNTLMGCYGSDSLPDLNLPMQNLANNSPTETCLEARSLTSSSSDGWVRVDYHNPYQSMDAFQDPHTGSISNPEQTLHLRTFSDSSHSDAEQLSQYSGSSYVEISHAVGSPGSDSFGDLEFCNVNPREPIKSRPSPPAITTSTLPKPIPVKEKKPISPQRSPVTIAMSSPTNRRQSRKNTSPKTTKTIIQRKPVQPSKAVLETTEKKVGRRKGPLRPDQRKQASEIRKLGACLRCKFLKKTCDKGEPCQGCLPSHARLWQVPCTRIDIKDIAYFMKDWKADYERHPSLDFPAENIKGYSESEKTFFVTHGYGYYFPVQAREVFVQDVRYFGSDWMEPKTKGPEAHHVNTMRFSAGLRGVSSAALSEYLDAHIEGRFEEFVDSYFEGTPFVTDMVKTVYRFWRREQTPVIRKSLKLLLAYNLTQHITMLVGKADEEILEGRVYDGNSKIRGEIIAPVMINFQVKTAMADMWRELQKDVLEELSQLYSSVYSRDKLKHWPTIFMVATILLTVWEEMQFDCHYRVLDPAVVNKFCYDMESTPVGVIVNLFLAISQKLPALSEWDTHKHRNLLNDNPAVNEALTEVRANVNRHDTYLRGRCNATFDRDDFDSLSNKFTSKLVIRAN